jgi:hypothetical protein
MSVSDAQSDMRNGYCSGAAGVLASALAWSVATGVAMFGSTQQAIWALLIGGALIHPMAVLLCKLLGARGAHASDNPLGQLAGSSTVWLILCLPLAYGLGLQNPAWFFAAMLLVIGGRYTVFATLYGLRLYWVLGLALAAAGFALTALNVEARFIALTGAAVELVFAGVLIAVHRRSVQAGQGYERPA